MSDQKLVKAAKVEENMERNPLVDEKEFIQRMRKKIYQLTDYDVEPNDTIYPLLACLFALSRGNTHVLRGYDADEWAIIQKNIRDTLSRYYGMPGPGKLKLVLWGGVCVFGGIVIGIALALFFRIMAG